MLRLDRVAPVVGVAAALISALSDVDAQQRARTLPDPPPRVAGIAPPPPSASQPGQPGEPPNLVHPPVRVVNPIVTGYLPAFVLPDGRVFADFGRGYEQIIRSCAATSAIPYGSVGVMPPAAVGGGSAPITTPRYEAPRYIGSSSGTSASGSNASAAGSASAPGSSASAAGRSATGGVAPNHAPPSSQTAYARASCWTTTAMGSVIVIR